jgi:hypothetical protein
MTALLPSRGATVATRGDSPQVPLEQLPDRQVAVEKFATLQAVRYCYQEQGGEGNGKSQVKRLGSGIASGFPPEPQRPESKYGVSRDR